eukprot:TRINITY_DN815_c0_g1_i1.p1 TRINITY_DN815_c0_g1~~TRINITY_DN815_c0_g1_i1.p1  ORF type:complete len:326 (-),score=88.05 TRINITY_DN815_c0_g1_i1:7-984(-)
MRGARTNTTPTTTLIYIWGRDKQKMSLDIRLKRVDRVYKQGELLSGVVVVSTKGAMSHAGITIVMEGSVQLLLSAKSVGLFDAFYNSIKPVQLLQYSVTVAEPGKLPDGVSELPFEFQLEPLQGQQLYDTYHGVFVNIQYSLRCDMKRGLLAKDVQRTLEFIIEVPSPKSAVSPKVPFTITPETLENIKKASRKNVPNFKLTGDLSSAVCSIEDPFTGNVVLESSDAIIKSVELQLVRVETCGCADGYAKEATEIQNIQIADGDICRGLEIPIYMVFPRLFTCSTVAAKTFKIEFEVNLVVMLDDGHLITENFPIKLVRGGIATK